MNSSRLRIILLLFVLALGLPASMAQIVSAPDTGLKYFNPDSIRHDFDNQPFFGLYKDNYFAIGAPVGQRITRQNSGIKFQISFAQRLTRSSLPFGTYLYLFYSQKCFWNVFEDSMPMTDLNFNPGIGLSKPLFVKNRYIGKVTLMVEHESNGRDSIWSRSWNKVSLATNIIIDPNMMVHGKIWIPIVDGQHNRDILKYCGIYQVGVQVLSANRRFVGNVTLVKRQGWNLNFNTIVDIGYRIFRNANEFIFLQYYNGYGEGLLDYNKFHTQLRFGLLIKPKMFSDF